MTKDEAFAAGFRGPGHQTAWQYDRIMLPYRKSVFIQRKLVKTSMNGGAGRVANFFLGKHHCTLIEVRANLQIAQRKEEVSRSSFGSRPRATLIVRTLPRGCSSHEPLVAHRTRENFFPVDRVMKCLRVGNRKTEVSIIIAWDHNKNLCVCV